MSDIVVCLFSVFGFEKAAKGLVGEGRRLAAQCGGALRVILVGDGAIASEIAPLADSVIVADQAELSEYQPESYLAALTELCRNHKPTAVLLGSDTYSLEAVARLAHRLGGSAVCDGSALRLDGEKILVTRQVYGGKAQAEIELKRSPAVVSLRSRSLAPASPKDAPGEVQHVVCTLPPMRTRIIERKVDDPGNVRLEDARIIVAGGRGIGGAEPFSNELRQLADILGAQMAASRAACDAGWVPATWQVGQTGKKVAPELYIAIGVSGASQHMTGVSEAKNIVAINSDPEAPIFKYCSLGMVADYREVLPLLRSKLGSLHK